MGAIIWLLGTIISVVFWLVLLSLVLNLLVIFGVANPHNPQLRQVMRGLDNLLEPMLGPIRKILPQMSGIDLSPVVLLIGLQFIQRLLIDLTY